MLSLTDVEILKSLTSKDPHKNVLGQIVNYMNEGNAKRWQTIYMRYVSGLSIQ